MVLFKFTNDLVKKASESIYIPLWSYSNKNELYKLARSNVIYIPLWSYSNFEDMVKKVQSLLIYIPLWSYSNVASLLGVAIGILFTFHYGPIQIMKKYSVC